MRLNAETKKELEKKILQLFEKGMTNGENIAIECGCSPAFANKVIKNNGYTRADRFRIVYNKMFDDYKNGKSIRELSYKYNFTTAYIKKLLQRERRNNITVDIALIKKIEKMIIRGLTNDEIIKVTNVTSGVIKTVKNRLYGKIKNKRAEDNPYYTHRWAVKGTIVDIYDK